MNMSTRLRKAWELLAEELKGVEMHQRRFFEVLRGWLQEELGATSKKADAAMTDAGGIQMLLDGDPSTFPITPEYAAEFQKALREGPPKDPERFVVFVDELCWNLVVFRRPDSACPQCQSDQEQWTDEQKVYQICNLMSCCVDERGEILYPLPEYRRPLTRDEVLARFPGVELVTVRD